MIYADLLTVYGPFSLNLNAILYFYLFLLHMTVFIYSTYELLQYICDPLFPGVSALVEAASALCSSKLSPVSISIIPPPVVTELQPNLRIHVSNMLGRLVQPALSPIIAQSATRIADDVVVLAKQPLGPGVEKTDYNLPLK